MSELEQALVLPLSAWLQATWGLGGVVAYPVAVCFALAAVLAVLGLILRLGGGLIAWVGGAGLLWLAAQPFGGVLRLLGQ